jgi:predicted nucleotidyltransferase
MEERELVDKLRQIKSILVEKYSVSQIGYFGSYAIGQATESSDVDIFIEFSQPVGWEFFRVQDFLETTIGKSVDLVTPKAIKPQLRQTIYNQLKYV